MENLPDDIVNNYYNFNLNDDLKVKFYYDRIFHQLHISSFLEEKIKVKGMLAKIFTKSGDEFEIKSQKLIFYLCQSQTKIVSSAFSVPG